MPAPADPSVLAETASDLLVFAVWDAAACPDPSDPCHHDPFPTVAAAADTTVVDVDGAPGQVVRLGRDVIAPTGSGLAAGADAGGVSVEWTDGPLAFQLRSGRAGGDQPVDREAGPLVDPDVLLAGARSVPALPEALRSGPAPVLPDGSAPVGYREAEPVVLDAVAEGADKERRARLEPGEARSSWTDPASGWSLLVDRVDEEFTLQSAAPSGRVLLVDGRVAEVSTGSLRLRVAGHALALYREPGAGPNAAEGLPDDVRAWLTGAADGVERAVGGSGALDVVAGGEPGPAPTPVPLPAQLPPASTEVSPPWEVLEADALCEGAMDPLQGERLSDLTYTGWLTDDWGLAVWEQAGYGAAGAGTPVEVPSREDITALRDQMAAAGASELGMLGSPWRVVCLGEGEVQLRAPDEPPATTVLVVVDPYDPEMPEVGSFDVDPAIVQPPPAPAEVPRDLQQRLEG